MKLIDEFNTIIDGLVLEKPIITLSIRSNSINMSDQSRYNGTSTLIISGMANNDSFLGQVIIGALKVKLNFDKKEFEIIRDQTLTSVKRYISNDLFGIVHDRGTKKKDRIKLKQYIGECLNNENLDNLFNMAEYCSDYNKQAGSLDLTIHRKNVYELLILMEKRDEQKNRNK